MWSLIIAACVGIFSSMFSVGPSAGMARYDKDEAPAYRQEYSSSYFDEGFQKNQESGNNNTLGNTSESSSDERKIAGVYIPSKTDVTAARSSENENSTDALTVLSGR